MKYPVSKSFSVKEKLGSEFKVCQVTLKKINVLPKKVKSKLDLFQINLIHFFYIWLGHIFVQKIHAVTSKCKVSEINFER